MTEVKRDKRSWSRGYYYWLVIARCVDGSHKPPLTALHISRAATWNQARGSRADMWNQASGPKRTVICLRAATWNQTITCVLLRGTEQASICHTSLGVHVLLRGTEQASICHTRAGVHVLPRGTKRAPVCLQHKRRRIRVQRHLM